MQKTTTYTAEDFKLAVTKAAAMLFVGATEHEAANVAVMSLINHQGRIGNIQVKEYVETPLVDEQSGETLGSEIGDYIYRLNNPGLNPLKEDIIVEAMDTLEEWEDQVGTFKELFGGKIKPTPEEVPEALKRLGIPPFSEAVSQARQMLAV